MHNVKTFRVTKPENFYFTPGLATDLSLNKEGWKDNKHPFTFTCLPSDDYLEFTIKLYASPEGLTYHLNKIEKGATFEISDAWGALEYKGEGIFIAGGAGVTPFISIFRHLNKQNEIGNNVLMFSNNKEDDIILKNEFENMLRRNFINIITSQPDTAYYNKRLDNFFLEKEINDFNQKFMCADQRISESILHSLKELGADAETSLVPDLYFPLHSLLLYCLKEINLFILILADESQTL